MKVVRRGEGRDQFRSLTLVLDGNSPRFPWEPSTTMLISRHTGTTDDSVSDRSTHSRFSSGPAAYARPAATVSRTPIFAPATAGPAGALGC